MVDDIFDTFTPETVLDEIVLVLRLSIEGDSSQERCWKQRIGPFNVVVVRRGS
jgi:hypothetical protein